MLHSRGDHGNSHANISIHPRGGGGPGGTQDGLPPPPHQRPADPLHPRVHQPLLDQEGVGPLQAVPALQHHQQPLLHLAQGTTVWCVLPQ